MPGRAASVCLRSGAARSTRRKPLATARFGHALPSRPPAGQPRSSRAQVQLRPRDLRRVPPADGLATAQDCRARPPVGSRIALPPALLRLICPNVLPCHFLVTAIDVRELLSRSEFRFSSSEKRGATAGPSSNSTAIRADLRRLRLALLRRRLDGLLALGRGACANLDLLRLGFSALAELQLKNAVVVGGADLVGVDGIRQREGTRERAVAALNAMEILFLFFLIPFALAANGQQVVFDFDVQIIRVDTRHFRADEHAVPVLVNVHGRNEAAGGQKIVALSGLGTAKAVLEQAAQVVLQAVKLTVRIPTGDSHC